MAGKKRTLGSLLVQVGADTRGLNQAMESASKRMKQFSAQARMTGQRARASFGGMGTAAMGAASRISTIGLGAVGGRAGAALGLGVPGLAIGAAGAGAYSALRGAARFSPAAVQMKAESRVQSTKLDQQLADKYPVLSGLADNWWDMAKNWMKDKMVRFGPSEATLADPGKRKDGTALMEMFAKWAYSDPARGKWFTDRTVDVAKGYGMDQRGERGDMSMWNWFGALIESMRRDGVFEVAGLDIESVENARLDAMPAKEGTS